VSGDEAYTSAQSAAIDTAEIHATIVRWAGELGFSDVAVAAGPPAEAVAAYRDWLAAGMHGEMGYLERNLAARAEPALLADGCLRIISLRMDYLTEEVSNGQVTDPACAVISRYAVGRDYHRVVRQRIARLAKRIASRFASRTGRAFVDSGPLLEKPIAAAAGLGWAGKHTNLLSRSGSWFFLGELLTDLPLPVGSPTGNHCGRCSACIDQCPTRAIVAPWQLDARRCIAYLTIELEGAMPIELRPLIGNHVFGCDICQAVCPWNRRPRLSGESDFLPRNGLHRARLIELIEWDEEQFLRRTEGSAIRRLGHQRWLRNLAVAIGNGPADEASRQALLRWQAHPSQLVREHVEWALEVSRTRER
jgi:epoxyqueuosine reductase